MGSMMTTLALTTPNLKTGGSVISLSPLHYALYSQWFLVKSLSFGEELFRKSLFCSFCSSSKDLDRRMQRDWGASCKGRGRISSDGSSHVENFGLYTESPQAIVLYLL